MRLKSIKLAGFKSFVDATTVPFQSNLTAVVGPNGCGKSNIIDAVRWVMGESSAKHLRGESMADVIFNGSVSRKPVSRAAIELVFDNSQGRAGGEYARFSEISVKREVTRDGQSKYFLNGTSCRRRDVTDLFLGTGLGPRSYAIIEQGMIARIIEAKPEELRTYVEEAAGVSKYKERRRETESRMVRTRENLERLTDLSDELGRQLDKLKRQADAAARYQVLRAEARDLEGLKLWLELQSVLSECQSQTEALRDAERNLEQCQSRQATHERTRIEQQVAREGLNQEVEAANGAYYSHQADLSRLEATKAAYHEQLQSLKEQHAKAVQERARLETTLAADRRLLADAQAALDTLAPERDRLQADLDQVQREISRLEESLAATDLERGHLASELGRVKSELTRLETERAGLTRQTQLETARRADLEKAISQLSDTDPTQIVALQSEIAAIESEKTRREAQLKEADEALLEATGVLEEKSTQCAESQATVNSLEVELARIDRILAAEARVDNQDIEQWMSGLAGYQGRVLSLIELPAEARSGFEACYPEWLDAFVVQDLSALEPTEIPLGVRVLSLEGVRGLQQSLKISQAPWDHEQGFTNAGLKYGPNWIERVSGEATGLLDLKAKRPEVEEALRSAQSTYQAHERDRELAEEERDRRAKAQRALAEQVAEQHTALITASQRLAGLEAKSREVAESRARLTAEQLALAESANQVTEELSQLDQQVAEVSALKTQLQAQLTPLHQSLDQERSTLAELRVKSQQLGRQDTESAVRAERLSGQIQQANTQIARIEAQQAQLGDDESRLAAEITGAEAAPSVSEQEFSEAIAKSQALEAALQAARIALNEADANLRTLESERQELERERERLSAVRSECQLKLQAVEIERDRLQASLKARDESVEKWAGMESQWADVAAVDTELARVQTRIERLGPINLVAVDEYQRELERKSELDLQHAELTEALETLEEAIKKIDRETRALFRQTFDAINQSFGEIFPELFGGGEAWLMLTDDDLLSTGVAIMARPPGKRNSSIYLLSGGEKALTALALVFAIFRLNPAPFCLLDEVDAPLDDANVGRYAEAVAKMAQSVQFIYITHNKIAMERASQLMGVTMSEPGVSRLVSVDIERAVELASQEP